MREISVIELSTLVTHRPRGTRFMATHPISRTIAFSGSASMNRSCHLQPLLRRSASHAIAWRSQSAIISWAMGLFCLQMRARNDARKGSHQGSDRGLSMSMHVGALIALLRGVTLPFLASILLPWKSRLSAISRHPTGDSASGGRASRYRIRSGVEFPAAGAWIKAVVLVFPDFLPSPKQA
jgi:hypothetical protein